MRWAISPRKGRWSATAVYYTSTEPLHSTFVNDGVTVLEVAQGKTDGYIRRFARDVRNYGRPVLSGFTPQQQAPARHMCPGIRPGRSTSTAGA